MNSRLPWPGKKSDSVVTFVPAERVEAPLEELPKLPKEDCAVAGATAVVDSPIAQATDTTKAGILFRRMVFNSSGLGQGR